MAEKYGGAVLSQRFILLPGILKCFLPTLRSDSVVLDLGCGNGNYTELIAKQIGNIANVKGIDISAGQIDLAKKEKPEIDFQVGKVEQEERHKYTDVFANMVICNISPNEIKSFFQNVARTLKSGGRFVITNVHSEFQKTFSDKYMTHVYPEPSKLTEGAEIKVSLNLLGGESIGPFVNFHYSKGYLETVAAVFGLELEGEQVLESAESLGESEKLDTPKYTILTFKLV